MRKVMAALAAAVLGGAGLLVGPVTQAEAVTCPATSWGSLAKTSSASNSKPLENIRTGRHDCYDRMVLDIPGTSAGDPAGYRVGYVSTLYQDGSGNPVPVSGGAIIEVRVGAPSYDPETGEPTYEAVAGQKLPGVDLTGYRTFRDARFAGSFEGDTQVGLGVRARLPFRVFQLDDRIVIDVAHSWTGS